jgi:hypothetical protein
MRFTSRLKRLERTLKARPRERAIAWLCWPDDVSEDVIVGWADGTTERASWKDIGPAIARAKAAHPHMSYKVYLGFDASLV